MTRDKLLLGCFLILCQLVWAQSDTIVLHEVQISDFQLHRFSKTQSVAVLNDSVIEKNRRSLTALLNGNSSLYFKENGLGMVSSVSFRGTTAQQTAVIWNGININSQLTGQTDFNTLPTAGYDNISIRSGGGSAIYGSGAIGGSVHLNNEIDFKKQFTNELRTDYGSFATFSADYTLKASDGKASAMANFSRSSSENDYGYRGTNKHNENGQYYNSAMSAVFGYRLGTENYLKFYSQLFEGQRHFSGTLAAKSKSKYEDLNARNLLEWDAFLGKFTSKAKVAFLSERYKYFENTQTGDFETATAETLIAKYEAAYALGQKTTANIIVDYTQAKGFGIQIGSNLRSIAAASLLLSGQPVKWFSYEFSARKEFTDNYKSPFLFGAGGRFAIAGPYTLLLNASRNFRIPDFNDLYWQGLGNAALRPESSYQAEIGQQLRFSQLLFSATAFYIDLKDMIQWAPGNSGIFRPQNVAKVRSYGAELLLDWKRKWQRCEVNLHANYAYVISKDLASNEQLQYVPVHKANATLSFWYRKIGVDAGVMFNGRVYTRSQKYRELKEYALCNAGINYDFGSKNTIRAGFRVENLFAEEYQNVLQRPMPGRNYTISLTLKI